MNRTIKPNRLRVRQKLATADMILLLFSTIFPSFVTGFIQNTIKRTVLVIILGVTDCVL